jgi:hypothetical protein
MREQRLWVVEFKGKNQNDYTPLKSATTRDAAREVSNKMNKSNSVNKYRVSKYIRAEKISY